jgi:hypothetical protein
VDECRADNAWDALVLRLIFRLSATGRYRNGENRCLEPSTGEWFLDKNGNGKLDSCSVETRSPVAVRMTTICQRTLLHSLARSGLGESGLSKAIV